MTGYVTNIETATVGNINFRKVLFTSTHCQLVLMCLQPSEEIGMEVHPDNDQFLRIEQGVGKVIMNGEAELLQEGSAIVVPAGTQHNIINTSATDTMKLYTVYSPAHHPDGTIHATKADAIKAEAEHS